MADPRLLAFGLYASEGIGLNDGVRIFPWRMGSGGYLRMGTGTRADAYTHVRGDFTHGAGSAIAGDVRYGGTYTPQLQPMPLARLIPDTGIAPLRMRSDSTSIPLDSSLVVEARQTRTLRASGSYPKTVMVRAQGTLVLVGGDFSFRSLICNSGGKIVLQADSDTLAPQRLSIRVSDELIIDNAVMTGVRLDPRSVLWKWDGATEIFLNGQSRFLGSLLAPRARVSMASNAGFQGSLWAREVVIHQYNVKLRFWPYTGKAWVHEAGAWVDRPDGDLDGVDDTLELRLGTDPLLADTDGDGYSDGLEVYGREGLYGAVKGISNKLPGSRHSWGWALDSTRRDLFHPLRRDQFLRLVWQDSADIRARGQESHLVWDSASNRCLTIPRYRVMNTLMFDGVWDDSAYLDHLVAHFADPSDKPLVDAPYAVRVPDYTVNLHLDAGPKAGRNLDPAAIRYGGGVIVSFQGIDTGRGPYAFDSDGDGRMASALGYRSWDCNGDTLQVTTVAERDSLLARMFRGWRGDPLRDVWIVSLGVAANQSPQGNGGYTMDHPVWSSEGITFPFENQVGMLHEYGHVVGLKHHHQIKGDGGTGPALLYDGAMNYYFNWGRNQRCSQTKGATWNDSRWCGDEPAEKITPEGRGWTYWMDASNPWFNITWWRSDTMWNPKTSLTDTVLYEGGGPLDPRTGFRKVKASLTVRDIRFSSGTYCDIGLDTLKEWEGISRCRDRHGRNLSTPVAGTPIDWNQNGVIDMEPVDLFGFCHRSPCAGDLELPYFLRLVGESKPVVGALLEPYQEDHPDWTIMALQKGPYNRSGNIPEIRLVSRNRDLKEKFSW